MRLATQSSAKSCLIFRRRTEGDGMAASSLGEAAKAVAMEEGEVEKGFDPMADAFFSSMNQYQNRDGEEVPAEYCDEVIDKEMEICPYYRCCTQF